MTAATGFDLAILGLAGWAPPDRRRILVSAIEHKSVLSAARAAAARHSMTCETVPVDPSGMIDPDLLAKLLSDDVLCVAAMAVNNESGTIQESSRPGESHPQALTEPDVSVAAHPALIVQPLRREA